MTLRELMYKWLGRGKDIDDDLNIRIMRLDQYGVITHEAITRIIGINSSDNLYIYEDDIEWKEFR